MKKRIITINQLDTLYAEMGLLSDYNCWTLTFPEKYLLHWRKDYHIWQLSITKETLVDPFDKTNNCTMSLVFHDKTKTYRKWSSLPLGANHKRYWLMPIELLNTPKVLAETLTKMMTDLNLTPQFGSVTIGRRSAVSTGLIVPQSGIIGASSATSINMSISHSIQI
jgi:hypothetical protein